MAKISFVISKVGDVKLEVSNVKGMDCEELTKCFEQALGTKVKIDYKPEDFVVLDSLSQYVSEE